MRHFKILVISAICIWPAFSQGATSGAAASVAAPSGHTNLHAMDLQLRRQRIQIAKDFKSGKLTRDQAKAKKAQLKKIRQQELQFYHQNGGHQDITDDQKGQLQQQFDQTGSN